MAVSFTVGKSGPMIAFEPMLSTAESNITGGKIVAAVPLCKICSTKTVRHLYRSQHYGFQEGRCTRCGSTFVLDKINDSQLKDMYGDDSSFERFSNLMDNEKVSKRHLDALHSFRDLLPSGTISPRIFDVGAGSGAFLNQARRCGYEVNGNELSDSAIRMAQEKYGIALSPLPLGQDKRSDAFDVITMWGLIEHVLNPIAVLKSAFAALCRGGILFIYTPDWCMYDDIGLSLARLVHWTRLLDRRITLAHLNLFSAKGMKNCISAIGYEIIRLERVCEYNFPTSAYLESLGVPVSLRRPIGSTCGCFINHGIFFRNNMRVFCRKPMK
jgi:2-polyprenyl-3-methyl-5-hydroxy-6-metoxy-1,4-benzoquinol methylase